MYVCTYVPVYVCTYVHMYLCMYVRMSVCPYVPMYLCSYVAMYYVCMCLCMYCNVVVLYCRRRGQGSSAALHWWSTLAVGSLYQAACDRAYHGVIAIGHW